ncbi:RidA family protein [Mycolicibacterium sp. OfavD-34-C]|uniref:RidA family protein n=1 Tax=Mycolicibacterium sp. OfavD-34-C TaxID=2917746 RepID=UPI001EF3E715|nr:RidA family protein [Mycolicibacterium sp. OfavD-34-C]MCG7578830.1 RidA family protein [Mycolicibacterium sp. OfavD-34-C]
MTIQRINPSQLFDSKPNGHSQGTIVESGKLAFFSGQVAWSPQHTAPPDSLAEQTQIVTANLQVCLDSVGATRDDIVMARVYIVDLTPERLNEAFPALLEFFGDAYPSLTGIGVQALAGPELHIEIEMVVRVPG